MNTLAGLSKNGRDLDLAAIIVVNPRDGDMLDGVNARADAKRVARIILNLNSITRIIKLIS